MAIGEPLVRRDTGNLFLDALPEAPSSSLTRRAELRVFREGSTLAMRGEPIREVHFPVSGAIGQLEQHEDGRSVEIMSVGCEGISGFEFALGMRMAQFTRVTTVPLTAFVVSAHVFARTVSESPVLAARLGRYAVTAMRLAAISAACERHDLVEARLARWLLQLHAQAGTDEMALTHERAALMLNLQRAGVTRAYAKFARAGIIRVERGRVRIVDAAGLRGFACICQDEAKRVVDDLYG